MLECDVILYAVMKIDYRVLQDSEGEGIMGGRES